MMQTRLKQVNIVHRELKTTLEEKIVAYFWVFRHCVQTQIPTETAQDCGNAGRESNRKTARCVLDSHSTKYVPRFYFLFHPYVVVCFLLLNTVGQCTLVQRHLVTVSGPGCTLDWYYLCLRNQSRHSNTAGSVFYKILLLSCPWERQLCCTESQQPLAHLVRAEMRNSTLHFRTDMGFPVCILFNTLCTWTIR
jgi:hypothetical protein